MLQCVHLLLGGKPHQVRVICLRGGLPCGRVHGPRVVADMEAEPEPTNLLRSLHRDCTLAPPEGESVGRRQTFESCQLVSARMHHRDVVLVLSSRVQKLFV